MSTEAKRPRKPRAPRQPGAPYTVAEAADRLNLAVSTIYDLIRDGQIPARKVGVKRARYRIDEADLMAYWQACLGDGAGGPGASRGATRDHLS